ncbi:MAG: hypothetical protein K6F98_07395 [Bacteroidales bacterium]|nr:hypothetical protein [Bacteroidales bacterium]
MKEHFHLDILRSIFLRKVRSRQWLTYGVCLFVAAVFWYINKLDNTYNQEDSLRVKYIDYPEDMVVMQPPVPVLHVGLKADGFTLFQHVSGLTFRPFILNVSALQLKLMSKGRTAHYVTAESIRSLLADYYGADCEIAYIRPDTIWFAFDRLATRDLPVKPVLEVEADKGHEVVYEAVSARPARIKVSGPASVLDTLPAVYTVPVQRRHLTDTLVATVRMVHPEAHGIQMKQQKIAVTVPVVKTENPENPPADGAQTEPEE